MILRGPSDDTKPTASRARQWFRRFPAPIPGCEKATAIRAGFTVTTPGTRTSISRQHIRGRGRRDRGQHAAFAMLQLPRLQGTGAAPAARADLQLHRWCCRRRNDLPAQYASLRRLRSGPERPDWGGAGRSVDDGERAVARAVNKFGTMFGVSSLGTVSLEEIASNFSFPQVYQFYFHKDRGLNKA